MTRVAMWAAALLVASPALAADIKVGVYGPYTGGSAGMGVSMRNGVEQAADEINAKGGINGQKVVLVKRDDEAKNERGAQIMQEFLDKEKVIAVLGPINTGVADNSTRYANERKVPVIINASAGAKVNEEPTIAIVDTGGALMYLERPDQNSANTVNMATGKARTAAMRARPSSALEARVKERPGFLTVPGALAVRGGVPIFYRGECVGGG